jgi:hypothetical protein
MTAVSAEENSRSSKRSWNLKAELSPICLSAGGAGSTPGPIKAAPLAASSISASTWLGGAVPYSVPLVPI